MKECVINPDWDGSWNGRKDLFLSLLGPRDEELASVALPNCHLKNGHAMADGVTFRNFPYGVEIVGLCIRSESKDWICKIYEGVGLPVTGNGGDVEVNWKIAKFIIHKDRMKAHAQGKEGSRQEQVFS